MKVFENLKMLNLIEKLNESKINLRIDITPLTTGQFIAYDPIAKSRIYKKGTIIPIKYDTEKEAFEKSVKILNKKYGKNNWIESNENKLDLKPFSGDRDAYGLYTKYKKELEDIIKNYDL